MKIKKTLLKLLPDSLYVKLLYHRVTREKLNIDNPQTFNEKLQWLKLHDRNPQYTIMVDKYLVREYIKDKIGEEYLIPLLGVWDTFDEIDFNELPNKFVLKCNHDCGGLVFCTDKSNFNKEEAKKKINACLKQNYYWGGREWPYKDVKPKIIAEKFMVDETGKELKDYKIFCFDGEVKMIQVDFDRFANHRRNLYTTNWEYVDLSILYPTDKNVVIRKPEKLDLMIELASKLSKGIPHLRVDFYSIYDKIYFGELTLYHGSGFEKFTPEDYNLLFGSWIKLPIKEK